MRVFLRDHELAPQTADEEWVSEATAARGPHVDGLYLSVRSHDTQNKIAQPIAGHGWDARVIAEREARSYPETFF